MAGEFTTKVLRTVATLVGVPGSSRIIIDGHRRLNYPVKREPTIDTSINKEAASRDVLFADSTPSGRFLEIGGGDGKLVYLLGISGNFAEDKALYEASRKRFDEKFQYYGIDLKDSADGRMVG